MAIQAAAATRAPRGPRILAQAFFEAADGIPAPQRDAVVKAALAAIRDQLKETLAKAKVAKAKTKAAPAKAAPSRRPKAAAPAAKKQPAMVSKTAKRKKGAVASKATNAGAKPASKPVAKPVRKTVKPAPEAASEPAAV